MQTSVKPKGYIYKINGEVFRLVDTCDIKGVRSKNFNLNFNKKTGYTERWGSTLEDDPLFSPIGPEILDLEISVDGCPNSCRFCYKSNTPKPATNMSFETFKTIIDKMPRILTQVAFGITGIQTNPDFIKMMEYCREIGVIPNFTLTGIDLTDEIAEKVAKLSGALAVSCYQTDKNVCYDTIKKFTDLGMDQVNMHLMVSGETLEFAYEVLNDRMNDPRLAKNNAIVFLGVKPKGRAKDRYNPLTLEEYDKLVKFCLSNDIAFGFDSCSAPKFEASVRASDLPQKKKDQLIQSSESCESFGLFSSYINVRGEYSPCSFTEGEVAEECGDWSSGLSVLECDDFLRDIWYNDKVNDVRVKSIKTASCDGCRRCLTFPEIN
jgi:MoaA/NifB/PqqE/SkfB family radical SAM enzyme